MAISSVSAPVFNKQSGKYQVRWVEDGKRRTRTTFDDRGSALLFRADLLGTAPPPATAPEVAKRLPRLGQDADEQEWAAELTYYRDAIRAAFDARDDISMEMATKAARAIGTLVTAHASNRDIRRLRAKLDEVEAWRASLTSAGVDGTRIDPVRQGEQPTSGPLRREDSVH